MNIFLELFLTFAKIGLFTFGGGYAMISLIEDTCVNNKKWMSHDEMMDMTVIAESTPGPVAINCATIVGFRKAGISGALVATTGVVLPSFVIIFIISKVLNNFLDIVVVANAFKGIKIAVGILIISVAAGMIRKMKKRALTVIILLPSFFVMMCINIFAWNFSSIAMMIIAAAVSLVIYCIAGRREDRHDSP